MIAVAAAPKRRWIKHLGGATLTLLCLVVFVRNVSFPEVLKALENFRWPYLILGLCSLSLDYALRIGRWTMMLRATKSSITFGTCAAPFLGSIALNNVLPLRLGDIVRALVFPMSMGISRTTATSSLIVERMIDLMTLLASLAIGLLSVHAVDIPAEFQKSAIWLVAVAGITTVLGLRFSEPLGRFFAKKAGVYRTGRYQTHVTRTYATLGALFHGFDAMSRPRLLCAMLSVSMLIWAGEAGLFYVVLLGLGIAATPAVALLVMAVATLSTLVPSSPGYVGPFHLAAFAAISLVGGTAAQAGSYAVLVHLALWLPTTLAGALAIWLRPELFRAARKHANYDSAGERGEE